MMFRGWSILPVGLLFVAVVLALFPVNSVNADATMWSAWLYDSASGSLTLHRPGEMPSSPGRLVLATGFEHLPSAVAISHDWKYFAYVLNAGGDADQWQSKLMIYDRETQKVILEFSRPNTLSLDYNYQAGEDAFNENDSIAYSYSFDDFGTAGWEIRIFRLPSGAAGPVLRSGDQVPITAGLPDTYLKTPIIRRYSGNRVIFSFIQGGSDGVPDFKGFIWDTTTGQVTPSNAFTGFTTDVYEPSGETISNMLDERFPDCGSCTPSGVANVLMVSSYLSNAPAEAFYTSRSSSLMQPTFIQNGERILVTSETCCADEYRVLGRNGSLVGSLPDNTRILEAIGWQDGFLYLSPTSTEGQISLIEVTTRNGIHERTIWTGPNSTHLLKTPQNMQSKGPFDNWAQVPVPAKH